MDPVNFAESVPPNVNSPFALEELVVGTNDTPMTSVEMVLAFDNVSGTVGIKDDFEFVSEPCVNAVGPIPRIPSTPEKPLELEATPID